MTRLWSAICAGAAGLLLVAGAAQAKSFTLADALGVAYETNPQLAAQRAALRATDENVAKANAGWRPSINAQGEYGTQHYELSSSGIPTLTANSHPLQGQVTLNQPVFRGGRTWAEIARAKALVRAGRNQLADVEQTVLLDGVTAYMDVVRDQAIVNLRQHNVDVLTKQLKATELQFKVGELTRTDVAQSQARLAGARSDLVTAQGQLAVSRANFVKVIGRPVETLDADVALPALPGTLGDAEGLAEQNNPTLLAARQTERAASLAIDDSVGALLPQISLQAQYGYSRGAYTLGPTTGGGGPGTINTTSLMAELTIPIYQGGADEADVRQAKQLHSQAQLNVFAALRQTRDAVDGAWESFQSAQSAIGSDETQLNANKLAFEGVRREQEVGARTVLDVLNAEQELLNSQVAVVTSRRNAVVAAYQLLAAVGGLTARGLALKVKYYDPNAYYDDNAARWFGFGD